MPYMELLGEEAKLPRWFFKVPIKGRIDYHAKKLFLDDSGLTEKIVDGHKIILSIPERAILEVLSKVPHQINWDEALFLFEGLKSLRIKFIHRLLKNCNRYGAKRIFLYLAEEFGHAWSKKVKAQGLDLGKGVISLAGDESSKFISKYKISIPKDLNINRNDLPDF